MKSNKSRHRVIFYSVNDLAIPIVLENIDQFFDGYDGSKYHHLNDYLEFYNIKKYFDNNIYYKYWSQKEKESKTKLVEQRVGEIKNEIRSINDDKILNIIEELENEYQEDFWDLISNYHAFKNISKVIFRKLLKHESLSLRCILYQGRIVKYFSEEINDFLLYHKDTAILLLRNYTEKIDFSINKRLFFPKTLKNNYEEIFESFINQDTPNLNYLELTVNSKELNLPENIKFKAKKRLKSLYDEFLAKNEKSKIQFDLEISKGLIKPIVHKVEKESIVIKYSEDFIEKLLEKRELFRVFILLFNFFDGAFMIDLINKKSELNVLERISVSSKNEYKFGEVFRKKEILSDLQFHLFSNYLNTKELPIEKLIDEQIEHLNSLLFTAKFQFETTKNNNSYLEKIKNIIPEFDKLLKQYKYFVRYDEIDFEFLNFSSESLNFSDIGSLNQKKYIYLKNKDFFKKVENWFFSDQSILSYLKGLNNKYTNFFDVITNEKLRLSDFKEYQRNIINHLISEDYLVLNEDNLLEFKDITLIYIAHELRRNGSINYWLYPPFVRERIDKLIEEGVLYNKKTLFSSDEVEYLNFYLNNKSFTNGYQLRNKYIHGNYNKNEENKHFSDYFKILKMIVLVLFKMENDIQINLFLNRDVNLQNHNQ